MSRITDNELLREYRQAKNKLKQIRIMQELYALSKEEVLKKLRNAGIDEMELPKAMRAKNIEELFKIAEEKGKAREDTGCKDEKENEGNKSKWQQEDDNMQKGNIKRIPKAAVEAIEKEMELIKKNIDRESERFKELVDFLESVAE